MDRLIRAVVFAIALAGVASAGDIDENAKRAFEGLSSSWKGESAGGVTGYFPEGDAKVSIRLPGRDGSFSRDQAEGVLDRYFGDVGVVRVSLRKNGYNGGGKSYSATYDYTYSTADGEEHDGLLQFSIKDQDGRWVLQSVRVE